MTDLGTEGIICFQQLDVEIDWEIEGFSSTDSHLCSPKFDFCGRPFYLTLYPNGRIRPQSEAFISLFLVLGDSGPPLAVQYSLGIKSANGVEEVWINVAYHFCKENHGYGILRSELFRRRDDLLPKDVLTVTAKLKMLDKIPLEKGIKNGSVQTAAKRSAADVSVQTPFEHNIADVSIQTELEDNTADGGQDELPEKTGGEKVLQDMKKLYISGENSDVVLKVKHKEFKAHRSILAVRTPVLGAMFKHDTAEKVSGEVTIDDCEPAVFEQLLHYIYTGAPHVLTAENASALYVLADKYIVSEVKALCVRCMQDALCLDTFCNTVELSLMYREHDLLEMAIDFLSKNVVDVMKTVEWQNFLREHSTWANEILIRALEPKARNVRKKTT